MQLAADSVTVLQRLKEETRQAHQRAEDTLQIFSSDFDLARYVILLERFYEFWTPLEAQLKCFEELGRGNPNFHNRFKSHLLAADLRIFGRDPARLHNCGRLPRMNTFHQALGCLYVLEGSTLGAQVIGRHLQERFQIGRQSGAAFFNADVRNAGQCWREFCGFLVAHCSPSHSDQVVSSALETFDRFTEWFAQTSHRSAPR